MDKQHLKKTYDEFISIYPFQSNENRSLTLLRGLAQCILEIKTEALAKEDIWLTPESFCVKYPDIINPASFYDFRRVAMQKEQAGENQKFIRFAEQKKFLINPKNFFIYIIDNKQWHTKIYARLRIKNFFDLLQNT